MRSFPLVFACLCASGCLTSEIGEYAVDQAVLEEAVCTADVEAQAAATWRAALERDVIDGFWIAQDPSLSVSPSQAQFRRSSDGSTFWSDLHQEPGRLFLGSRVVEDSPLSALLLGEDFSDLLQPAEDDCRVGLVEDIEVQFPQGGWGRAEGQLEVELLEVEFGSCLQGGSCVFSYRFESTHLNQGSGSRLTQP